MLDISSSSVECGHSHGGKSTASSLQALLLLIIIYIYSYCLMPLSRIKEITWVRLDLSSSSIQSTHKLATCNKYTYGLVLRYAQYRALNRSFK